MAGPYYVDISDPGDWRTHTGLDKTTNMLRGFTGLLCAVDLAVAGEIVYIKGSSSDMSKYYNVPYDASNGTALTNGEVVSWHDGTGVFYMRTATTTTPGWSRIELLTGNIATDNDVITGASSGGTITTNAAAGNNISIYFGTKDGSLSTGYIKYIGCADDADFTVTYTDRVLIDVKSVAVHGFEFIKNYLWFENIEVTSAGTSKSGFCTASGGLAPVFYNCSSHNNGSHGFDLYSSTGKASVIRCLAYSNTGSGFRESNTTGSKFVWCVSRDNTAGGIENLMSGGDVIGCVIHGNTGSGIYSVGTGLVFNGVFDNNGLHGIVITNSQGLIIGNRITNQSVGTKAGISASSCSYLTGWNYFENNDTDAVDSIKYKIPDGATSYVPGVGSLTGTDLEDLSNTEYGYVDISEHDFSTGYTNSGDPDLRRTAITIPWT